MTLVMNLNAITHAFRQTLSAPYPWSSGSTTQRRNSKPRLPLELCDVIVDYCRGDPRTLAACSLVCRAWVGRAQKHLFHQTYLSVSRLRSAQSLLRANPALATYIRNLTLDFDGVDTLAHSRDVLKHICLQTDSVETLKLTGISLFASLELDLLRNILPKRTTRLEFGKITVAPQSPLPALVASFPLLQDLAFSDLLSSVHLETMWEAAGPILVRLCAPLKTLRMSLAFSNPAVLKYAQWLATRPHSLNLRALCIEFDYVSTRNDAPVLLGVLLDTLGPPLEILELTMARDTNLSVIPFTLERATRLTCLRLFVRYSGSWSQDSPSAVRNWVVTLLSRMHQPSIRTIHLAVEDPGEEGYLFFEWMDELVSTLIHSDDLSGLQGITFESIGSPLASTDAVSLDKRLELLRQKTTVQHIHRLCT